MSTTVLGGFVCFFLTFKVLTNLHTGRIFCTAEGRFYCLLINTFITALCTLMQW